MAKKIAVVLLIGALMTFAFLQSSTISHTGQTFTRISGEISHQIEAQDAEAAAAACEEFSKEWEEQSGRWRLIMPHDHVDKVGELFVAVQHCTNQGDLQEAGVFAAQLEQALMEIIKMDKLVMENVF